MKAQPVFKLQLVTPEGHPLTFVAGGTFERELVAEIAAAVVTGIPALKAAILAKGVGIARTEAHVAADIETALNEVLPGLVRTAVNDVLYGLKAETLKLV